MATVVFILCSVTSMLCSVLLLRAYNRANARLLLWSALCFAGFAVNNILLIVDTHMIPETDLSIVRSIPAILGVATLVHGLIWDSYGRRGAARKR